MDIDQLIKEGTFPRDYRRCQLPSSINPALAYVMVHLAGLDFKDRILDPCCGSATILIERQLLKPCIYQGVDINPKNLECARKNIEAAKVKIHLKHGDIMDQKFPRGYFTQIISNLPYGLRSGSRGENIKLFKFLADKAINWLAVGGKAVYLTNSKKLLWNAFAANPNWKFLEEYQIKSAGLDLYILIYQKVS